MAICRLADVRLKGAEGLRERTEAKCQEESHATYPSRHVGTVLPPSGSFVWGQGPTRSTVGHHRCGRNVQKGGFARSKRGSAVLLSFACQSHHHCSDTTTPSPSKRTLKPTSPAFSI